ncbi:MAG: TRAP transporter small permease [Lachnospiraceae bacterium]|jgi:C4-dicarboxylate transporter DctQ subunit|nr:TRAP transporter small permease [Lachnospiraceae bacterium]
MEKKEFDWKKFIVNIDQYVSAVLFIVIMVLLFLQVVTRYVFRHSFTWTEELSVLLFVWMTYMGVSSAVTYRKNLRIDALLDVVPFRVKKLLLIISDVIFILFNLYLIVPFVELIGSIGGSRTPILGIPKAITYWLIPAILVISSAKLVYDIYRLWHEDEKRLGVSRPTIDLDSLEAEYKARMAEQHKKEVQ